MATKHTLKIQPRKVIGRKVKTLRAKGLVPANVFGHGIKSANLQISAKDFTKAYREVGESTLLYLQEEEKDDRPVLVKAVTVHPVTSQILHVDFHQVNLKEKVAAPVVIKLTGESLAEKDKLGILVQQLHEVEVEALPTDMPEHLEVDISGLVAVGDAIHVKDLKADSKVEVKTDPEAIIVKIEPQAKEEVAEAPAPAEGTEPVEGAEGEPPTEGQEEKKEGEAPPSSGQSPEPSSNTS